MMTPYSAPQLAKKDKNVSKHEYNKGKLYNDVQASMRVYIEQAFGVLKNRWRILKCLPVTVERSVTIINACVVLHNFCILNDDVWDDDEKDPDTINGKYKPKWHDAKRGTDPLPPPPNPPSNGDYSAPRGVCKREELAAHIARLQGRV